MNVKAGILAVLLLVPTTFAQSDVSGNWELAIKWLNDTTYARISLKVTGDKLSGTYNQATLEGTIKGSDLEFSVIRPNGQNFPQFKGRITGTELTGTGLRNATQATTWTAKRAATPPGQPRVLDFEPKEFHRVFSDAIPPALHIFPKDTVRTSTVDAGGVDSKGVTRSLGGNPETGPFFVEGAFPGDTLVVKLTKVRLNRDSAVSGSQIVGSALNPAYVAGTKYKDDFSSEWILDRDKGVARLKSPTERLKNYTVKLQPMMGCIAVAPPAHQALRTGFPGVFGGNMDYNQFREGTTIYLPVFAQGALLFIGDGHAAQGDGELTGDALETSMDVEFTVDLIRFQSTEAPRAEDPEYLMSSGIANSLSEALQASTTQLVNWLQRDYKVDPNEAAVLLGTAVRFDVAEVVDPLVHVVAKLRKDALAPVK
jgi:amidase